MIDTQTGSTDTATTTTDSGGLTAGELAYFKSGGEDVSGLDAPASDTQAATTTATGTTETGTARAPAADEGADAIEGEVSIEPDGTVRDRKTGRFVPHGAFAKERTEKQAALKERQELAEKYARVDERLQILTGAIDPVAKAAEKVAEETPPDPESDIFGAFKHAMTKIADLEKRLTDGDATAKAREEAANIETTYRADAARFAAATPDFAQAYTFVIKGRDAELQALGVTDQKERARIIASDERDLVQTALSSKRSPAETLYKYAQARGYKSLPVSDTASEKNAATADANAKLDAIERGQNATRSLATTGGGAPAGLTAEALVNMPDAEFEAFVKNNGAKFKALLGG